MLGLVATVFIVIAVYVSSVVTANTVATVVAGRTRLIALLRLIGSSARSQRAQIAREGLLVGIAGAAIGVLAGTGVAFALERVAVATDLMPGTAYDYANAWVALPAVAVVLTTWLASWVGSRRVLKVRPIQAIGNANEHDREELGGRRGRNVTALVFVVLGTALLVLGVVLGLVSPFGVLIGLVGGIVSFTGIVLGADVVMPPVLRLVGRVFGASPAARLAAENAVRHPERSSRMTIGLVIGVTLVTTFSVTMASYRELILAAQRAQPEVYAGIDEMLNVTVGVFTVLIGFSALIAAIGMVNTLSLSVMQRTRELGLLRALGFDRRQLRGMIVAESAALTLAATITGVVLGFGYGWAGAQALLGSAQGTAGVRAAGHPVGALRRPARRGGRAHDRRVDRAGAARDARLAGRRPRGRVGRRGARAVEGRERADVPGETSARSSCLRAPVAAVLALTRASRPASP